jgi:hypothetical protein
MDKISSERMKGNVMIFVLNVLETLLSAMGKVQSATPSVSKHSWLLTFFYNFDHFNHSFY